MKLKLLFALLIVSISNAQTQIGQDIKGKNAGDRSGTSVALSKNGAIVAIGAPYNSDTGKNSGLIRIFQNYVGGWLQIGKNINGKQPGDQSGESVSLSADGSIVAFGSPYNSNNGMFSGSVSVYENVFGNWIQIGNDINGKAAGDQSGKSISLSDDGTTIAIGAPYNSDGGKDSGHVRVFKSILNSWVQIGQSINGESINDLSGYSLSLSSNGDILTIGALSNSANGKNSGHVRIYQYTSGIWTQIGQDIDGKTAGDQFGVSVDLSENGTIVAIGSNGNSDNGISCGQVRVYENISGIWSQIGQDINGESAGDYTGGSVSLSADGTFLAIGAIGNGNSSQGHVVLFKFNLGKWKFIKSIKGKTAGDRDGKSVFLSANGSILATGAYMSDDNGLDSGNTRIFDLSGILSPDTFVLENFNIYPNPTTDILNIELKENLTLEKVLIYNTTGQLVKETSEKIINVSGFAKGVYNVQVLTNQGKATKKIMVK